jgi:hypothetical protein
MRPRRCRALATRALERAGAGATMAASTARALVDADAQGLASHGVSRIAQYAAHLRNGRADGTAVPRIAHERGGAVLVDAGCGLAFPACAFAVDEAIRRARAHGVALAAVTNSHHFGRRGVAPAACRRGRHGRDGDGQLAVGHARRRRQAPGVRHQSHRRGVPAARRAAAGRRPVAVRGRARQADGRRT